MFRFENLDLYYLFLAIPIVIILFIINILARRSALKSFGNSALVSKLMPNISKYKSFIKLFLLLIAMSSIILALMKPQFGTKTQEVKREGVEVIIALDISNSMLAEDIKPNRLKRAQFIIEKMIDGLYSDKISLILFAGEAFLQLPLTTDYSAAKLMVNSVETGLIPTQGTAIGSAIELAMESFSDSKTSKVLLIITDGENHEDDAIDLASDAAKQGIYIHTIGMGSADGGPIPDYVNNRRVGFLKDDAGNTVITKLDDAMLSQLASTANGYFFRSDANDVDLMKILEEIDSLEKTEFETTQYTDFDDKFQIAIIIALFFLIFDLFVSERKNIFFSKLFNTRK